MNPLISIIIPVFNSEAYIGETLESCIKQTYRNLEIIIVNDGSTDNSEEVIKHITDRRIQYYLINNSGPCYARNFGIAKASGTLFQFLDADDILDPEKIEKQVIKYCVYGDEYIYSGVMGNIVGNDKNLEKNFEFYYRNLIPEKFFNEMFSHFGKYYTTGMWLVPKNLIEQTTGWDENVLLNNDGEYFSRLIMLSKMVIFCPGAVFYYRRDVVMSVSKCLNEKRIYESWLYSYKCYVKNFKLFFERKTAHELGRKALSVYFCNSYPNHPDLLKECKKEISKLGFKSPTAYGGKIFRIVSALIGTERALLVKTLKNRN